MRPVANRTKVLNKFLAAVRLYLSLQQSQQLLGIAFARCYPLFHTGVLLLVGG
jgi:hypothetical protein